MFAAVRIAALAVIGYLVLIFFVQRRLAFPGTHRESPRSGPIAPEGVTQVWLETASGRIEAWYFPSATTGPGPTVVFAHGNGELIEDWRPEMQILASEGVGALAVEFPGYGYSEGSPTRSSLKETYSAAFDWLAARDDVDSDRIVAYGRSMGGAAASDLAEARPVAAMILQSTFSSATAIARESRVPGFLVRDRFDTRAVVAGFTEPILLMHGRRDNVIGYHHAEAIAGARPGLSVTDIDCAHNDCAPIWRDIVGHVTTFLTEIGLFERNGP
jgi:pimeloyl-ACP methyl ester carboxylesterase